MSPVIVKVGHCECCSSNSWISSFLYSSGESVMHANMLSIKGDKAQK